MHTVLHAVLVPLVLVAALQGSLDLSQATGRPAPAAEQDVSALRALTVPPGLQSADELSRFGAVTDLTLERGLEYDLDFVLAVVGQVPALQRLRITGAEELPLIAAGEASARMPLRLETPHAIFLGDSSMQMAQLVRYAWFLEQTALAEIARDTGLTLQSGKAVISLYGSEQHWTELAGTSTFWGYYSAQEQRIHMAHWKTPEAINTMLLTHELFHWLAWEEGRIDLPLWLGEGLAHNISWRVEQRTEGWTNPFVLREWLRVASQQGQPVPRLATYSKQDEYTVTAVAYLLRTRGRQALTDFFAAARSGVEFEAAFAAAFGVTTSQFEAEYQAAVAAQRKSIRGASAWRPGYFLFNGTFRSPNPSVPMFPIYPGG